MQPETPVRIGKYIVRGELGRGGMGVVYQAMDPLIERQVAIKTVSKSLLDTHDAQSMMRLVSYFEMLDENTLHYKRSKENVTG
ncbi:MAG: hypothetical protein H7238_03465 [Polaromonas sp.]|nr:hypothetical protein [Polaromonas sp.]